jgi:hypothetical protein
LSLCRTASWPYRLSHINALQIIQFYTSKDQSQKFSRKNIENWRSPENDFCLVFSFLVFGYWVIFFVFSQWKTPKRFIWGRVYFCTMDGFFRILKKAVSELKLIHRDISSAYLFLIVDLRERGTRFVLTLFTRHYISGQIILELILTIQNMEIYYRKPGSLANNNVNCIGFYWYKFNKLQKVMKCWRIFYSFCAWLFFNPFFCCRRVPLSLKSTIKKKYAEELSRWITFNIICLYLITLNTRC